MSEPTPMTAAEAHAAAVAEGLALLRAENATGFKYVKPNPRSASKPFRAELKHGGAVSDDDDDAPPPPAPAPPVLCYCERPAALLDGRWVCAQLVEGDFTASSAARTSERVSVVHANIRVS